MEYVHIEVIQKQVSKKTGKPCGDVIVCDRTKNATTFLLCDGLGSGAKANIYATMAAARIQAALQEGFSLRKVFKNMVKTMNESVEKELPYSAFTICRILNSGVAIILSFETPPPIHISSGFASIVKQNIKMIGTSATSETVVKLLPDDFLLLMSDGIPNAGMGKMFTYGWGSEHILSYIQNYISEGGDCNNLPVALVEKALELDGDKPRDDFSVALLKIRKGTIVNIFTGAPSEPAKDKFVVQRLINSKGFKIVSGGTTAKIVSRVLNKPLTIEQESDSYLTPPSYQIPGINLVTEGTVTLNQLYNVLYCDPRKLDKKNPVTDFLVFLLAADKVNIFLGLSVNKGNDNITFTQLGIIPRKKIIELIIDELKKMGKTVQVEYY